MTDQAPSAALIERAWRMYCDDTQGSMDVRDHWFELSPAVQTLYIEKASHHPRPFDVMVRLADAERIVRMVDTVGGEAIRNHGKITLTQGAALFNAAANYLVKYEKS